MPSPFPGMDPYLEAPEVWGDFHLGMIAALKAELNDLLPPGYEAWGDQYVWLHEPDATTRLRLGQPDTYVTAERKGQPRARQESVLPAPTIVTLPIVRKRGNRYIKILDAARRRVVTVIELLSPSNKDAGDDREAYLAKRHDYFASGTNVVEIDLLRSCRRLPMGNRVPRADYYVFVCRPTELPKAGVWPISVRDPLPEIPIPLQSPDDPVLLPLMACFERAYRDARYDRKIDYTRPPTPRLKKADAAWARALVANVRGG